MATQAWLPHSFTCPSTWKYLPPFPTAGFLRVYLVTVIAGWKATSPPSTACHDQSSPRSCGQPWGDILPGGSFWTFQVCFSFHSVATLNHFQHCCENRALWSPPVLDWNLSFLSWSRNMQDFPDASLCCAWFSAVFPESGRGRTWWCSCQSRSLQILGQVTQWDWKELSLLFDCDTFNETTPEKSTKLLIMGKILSRI